MRILTATSADVPALVSLINLAYRGESARQGWTHESDLVQGLIRTDEATVARLVSDPDGTVLKYLDDPHRLVGCVHLQRQGGRLYLGMLSVQPRLQGRGIGKALLAAAEAYAGEHGCRTIFMRVISAREELTAWYLRHGYRPTGQRKPFVVDARYGVAMKPLDFVLLEKGIA
ncbi:MAG: GNAT family N-acetyltransferase [Gemmatimonadales bacterium]